MNLHAIDWLIVAVPLVILVVIATVTRRHVKDVSDFMTGGRLAGRYLVAVSDGVAGMGLITVVAFFEFYYHSGFAVNHWQQIATPLMLVVTLTGFVIYRFRETRAMTLAQFFELRYSRRFRVFAGVVASVAGIVNFGLFPAVGARFFVYFCGLPSEVSVGSFQVPTIAPLMLLFLGIALVMVLFGGQITIMVTDCVQGIFSYGLYILIALAIVWLFSWDQITTALLDRPAGHSMLNPFDTGELSDFNIWFILIGVFGGVYTLMAWQGNSGYNCAAANPHEAKMGKVLGMWRGGALGVMIVLLAVAAYTFLNHPDFVQGATAVNQQLDTIENPTIRTQVQVPVAISHFLPVGIAGAFLIVMLFLMVSTDTTYLHSWGSILVQDVILPFRKRPLTPRGHLRLLRWSISGVAAFAFFFSLFFPQFDYILMFFALTGSLYLGGAGAAIIGGLYWKRGTTAAAWAAMLTGGGLSLFGFVMEQAWPTIARWWLNSGYGFVPNEWLAAHTDRFPINGQWMWGVAMVASVVVYVLVSLLTCRVPHNMDRMLHRGEYARTAPVQDDAPAPERWWKRLVGIDRQFTRGDRFLAWFVFAWSMLLFGVWLVVTLWNFAVSWPDAWWAKYFWIMGVWLALVVGTITGVWFGIGGTRDLIRLFQGLKTRVRDARDDGRVIGHVNADEAEDADPDEELPRATPTAHDPPPDYATGKASLEPL